MDTRRATSFTGALVLSIGLTVGWVDAPQPKADLIIRGKGVCGTAGPVGRYTLNWVVINPETNTEITVTSATESGAYKGGEVYLDRTRLDGGQSATATDGPVPGTTEGTVTLTVHYVFNDTGGEAESSGSLFLEGSCKTPDQKNRAKNGPSRVD